MCDVANLAGRASRDGQDSCVSDVFFFQAEDGIRDLTVTGVQTCALPILFEVLLKTAAEKGIYTMRGWEQTRWTRKSFTHGALLDAGVPVPPTIILRAGEEIGRASCRERCRSRWSPYH